MENMYQPGTAVFNDWVIQRKIGSGGYGSVYEIKRDYYGEYHAALKVITIPRSDAETENLLQEGHTLAQAKDILYGRVMDLVQEFRIMSRLSGMTNIVSYEDHMVIPHQGNIGWDILIRMELLTPLMAYAKEHPFSRRDIIQLGIDICRALELCQKYNVIHRDIKPENIFVSPNGDFKLGDFGIAKTISADRSNFSQRGTPNYMAPEVFHGREYGYDVDTYSLGLVLYRLLNRNRMPFLPQPPQPAPDSLVAQAFAKRIGGEPLPPPVYAKGRLWEIVRKATSYESKHRYSSPLQMRQELEAILYDEGDSQLIYPDGDKLDLPEGSGKREISDTDPMFGEGPEGERGRSSSGSRSREPKEREKETLEKRREDETLPMDREDRKKPLLIVAICVAVAVIICLLLVIIFLLQKQTPAPPEQPSETPGTIESTPVVSPAAPEETESSAVPPETETPTLPLETEPLPTDTPTQPSPTQSPEAEPTIEPTAEPTSAVTAEPTPEATVAPTPEPTAEPTPAPTPEPTPEPTPAPTPTPTPTPPPPTPTTPPANTDVPAPPAETPVETISAMPGAVGTVGSGGALVRVRPGSMYGTIGTLNAGDQVVLVSNAGGGWYQIAYKGPSGQDTFGYVSQDAINLTANTAPVPVQPSRTYYVGGALQNTDGSILFIYASSGTRSGGYITFSFAIENHAAAGARSTTFDPSDFTCYADGTAYRAVPEQSSTICTVTPGRSGVFTVAFAVPAGAADISVQTVNFAGQTVSFVYEGAVSCGYTPVKTTPNTAANGIAGDTVTTLNVRFTYVGATVVSQDASTKTIDVQAKVEELMGGGSTLQNPVYVALYADGICCGTASSTTSDCTFRFQVPANAGVLELEYTELHQSLFGGLSFNAYCFAVSPT